MPHTLEIHHVYVGHGDATVIAVRDDTRGVYTFKALIDASTSSGHNKLAWYFSHNFGNSDFDLAIASHYHDDHLRGLAEGLGTTIHATSLLDIGGYDLTDIEPNEGTAVPNANPPVVTTNAPYAPAGQGLFDAYRTAVKYSALRPFGALTRHPYNFPADFNRPITLATINNVPVTLTCYAANGFVYGTTARNTGGNANNPNNYCLAFILQYGAFRYYTGGDLGGSGGSYYDHETLLANALANVFPVSGLVPAGHVCAFKSNHHGSDHSNNTNFLNRLRPTVCVTSVGQHKGHGLPGTGFLGRLNASTSPSGHQGFFFTDMLPGRRATANGLFNTRANTTYEAGSGTAYILKVAQHQTNATASIFSVHRFTIPATVPATTSTDMEVDDEEETPTGPTQEQVLVHRALTIELAVVLGVAPDTIDTNRTLGSYNLNQTQANNLAQRIATRLGILPPTLTPTQTLTQLTLAIAPSVPPGSDAVIDEDEDTPLPTMQSIHTFHCH